MGHDQNFFLLTSTQDQYKKSVSFSEGTQCIRVNGMSHQWSTLPFKWTAFKCFYEAQCYNILYKNYRYILLVIGEL